jgi:DNA-binding MarR family transcriptional regulator
MEETDYRELTNMSTKDFHVLNFWRAALIACYKEHGAVSAGQVARHVGQARSTAKKYLDRLVSEKCAGFEEVPYNTSVMMKNYWPTKRGEK